jgi:hypothetical protein
LHQVTKELNDIETVQRKEQKLQEIVSKVVFLHGDDLKQLLNVAYSDSELKWPWLKLKQMI